jgi:hypothetical protein
MFDAVAAVGALADQSTEPHHEVAAMASALVQWLLSPRISERIGRLEERLTLLVSDGAFAAAAPAESVVDIATGLFHMPVPPPRVGVEDARAPAIGSGRIGPNTPSESIPVAYDPIRLRGSGAWRELPVGTIVRPGPEPVALATIGRDVIGGEIPAADTFPGRRPIAAGPPAAEPAVPVPVEG